MLGVLSAVRTKLQYSLRLLFRSLIAEGTLPAGYATDDGAGLLYRDTELLEALAERDDAGAYQVEQGPNNTAVETPLQVRRIG